MSDFDSRLYKALTSDTKRSAELNYELFGNNEWSGELIELNTWRN